MTPSTRSPGRIQKKPEYVMSQQPIKLYRHPLSGHAHRVELMLSLLGQPTELIFVDLMKGAHKLPEFLALNSFGDGLRHTCIRR